MKCKNFKKGRFVRLATSRTTDVLKRIQVLSNCSNRSAYEYTEEEINKIFSILEISIISFIRAIMKLAERGLAKAKSIPYPPGKDLPYQKGKKVSYPSGKEVY